MLKTIRTEVVAKLTLRMLREGDAFVGIILGGKPATPIRGDNMEIVWAQLRASVGQAHPNYFGFDGAVSRFLHCFPEGFRGQPFLDHERIYKVAAADYLRSTLPLQRGASAGPADAEAAMRAFSKTNMLSAFEQARTRDVLKSDEGAAFIRAAASLAGGESATALAEITRIFQPHGQVSWPAATYLPFLWSPDTQMFLKPNVTRDFAERVGHRFARSYEAALNPTVYEDLLDLAQTTRRELSALAPRDFIDIQSFIWIVGAYDETDVPASVNS